MLTARRYSTPVSNQTDTVAV